MQSFDDCLSGFIPTNPQQYFFLLSNCFNNPFAYHPFAASYQFQPPKQVLASSTLDLPFPANLSPSESPSTRKDCEKGKRAEKCLQARKTVTQREEQQQSFNIKINKNEPCIIYKKKNTESNIVNQTFSFLNSDRSKKPLSKILNNSQKAKDYYKIMTKIKQLNKKYINRNYLKRLLAFEPSTEFEKAFLKAKPTSLTIQQIKVILRKLIFNFLRQQVNMTLMTSGKIYKDTLPEHFWRKREIMTFLFSERQI